MNREKLIKIAKTLEKITPRSKRLEEKIIKFLKKKPRYEKKLSG